jgi:hypothetical protein
MTPSVPTTHPSFAELKKPELKFNRETGEVGTRFEESMVHVPPE